MVGSPRRRDSECSQAFTCVCGHSFEAESQLVNSSPGVGAAPLWPGAANSQLVSFSAGRGTLGWRVVLARRLPPSLLAACLCGSVPGRGDRRRLCFPPPLHFRAKMGLESGTLPISFVEMKCAVQSCQEPSARRRGLQLSRSGTRWVVPLCRI